MPGRAASPAIRSAPPLGDAGRAVLREAVRDGQARVTTDPQMIAARAAVKVGYLRADPRRPDVFFATDAGMAFLNRLARVE